MVHAGRLRAMFGIIICSVVICYATQVTFERLGLSLFRLARNFRALQIRAFFGLADQMVASVGNFVLLVLVARSTSPASFGVFAVAITTYVITISATQTLIGEVMLFEYPRLVVRGHRQFRRGALAAALLFGAAGSAIIVVIGALAVDTRASMWPLAVFMPFLALQDVERHILLVAGRQAATLINDSLWTLLEIGALVAYSATVGLTEFSGIVLWGSSGSVAAAFGLLQLRKIPKFAEIRDYMSLCRPYLKPLVAEYLVVGFAGNIVFAALSGVIGLAAVGSLRAAQALYAPLNSFFSASRTLLIPWMSRKAIEARPLTRTIFTISIGFFVATLFLTGVAISIPDSIGRSLFGQSWIVASGIVGLAGLERAFSSGLTGPILGLRALREVRAGFAARGLVAVAAFAFGILGGFLGGAAGALVGSILSWIVAMIAYGSAFLKVSRRSVGASP